VACIEHAQTPTSIQPFQGWRSRRPYPRVARASQPWAECYHPFRMVGAIDSRRSRCSRLSRRHQISQPGPRKRSLWIASRERSPSAHLLHPERMKITQPRVARHELPWVPIAKNANPVRVESSLHNRRLIIIGLPQTPQTSSPTPRESPRPDKPTADTGNAAFARPQVSNPQHQRHSG